METCFPSVFSVHVETCGIMVLGCGSLATSCFSINRIVMKRKVESRTKPGVNLTGGSYKKINFGGPKYKKYKKIIKKCFFFFFAEGKKLPMTFEGVLGGLDPSLS